MRQLIVTGLGREAPTVVISNNDELSIKALIEHYARRMTPSVSTGALTVGYRQAPICHRPGLYPVGPGPAVQLGDGARVRGDHQAGPAVGEVGPRIVAGFSTGLTQGRLRRR